MAVDVSQQNFRKSKNCYFQSFEYGKLLVAMHNWEQCFLQIYYVVKLL